MVFERGKALAEAVGVGLARGDGVRQGADLALALRHELAARGNLPADELQLAEGVFALGFILADLLLQLRDLLAEGGAARLLGRRVLRRQRKRAEQQEGERRPYAEGVRHLLFCSERD